MKQLSTLILILTACLNITATPDFKTDRSYHIVCTQFPQGCVTDGSSAGQPTPIYYLSTATNDKTSFWAFNEEEPGLFSIRNEQTRQYVTYDGVREDIAETGSMRRYVSMTDDQQGYFSLWTIEQQSEGVYTIRNAAQNDHIWDVRVDSYCLGTYANSNSANTNQRFAFYDEQGTQVTERQQQEHGGFNVATWFIGNTETLDGWRVDGGWFQNTGAGGAHYNYTDGASLVQPFVENWHDSARGPLEDCSLTQTLRWLPAGAYTLQADIMAVRQAYNSYWGSQDDAPATGVVLFANQFTVPVATGNDPPQRFTLNFTLNSQGDVDLGLRAVNTNANWIAVDNAVLYYNGSWEQLIEGEKAKVRAELTDYMTEEETENAIALCADDFDALETLRKSVKLMPVADPLRRFATNITIDGQTPVYVESLDLYLCPLPQSCFDKDYTAVIDYTPADDGTLLNIDGLMAAPGTSFRFDNLSGGHRYVINASRTNDNVVSTALTFTCLPVVRIYGDFGNDYSLGTIAVSEPGKTTPAMLNMKAKWRGGITNSGDKHKRNYHVKLLDQQGEKLEQKFFGLRNDNSWILEACQVDMSRIRNRVLTDLWNDFSQEPYYFAQEPKAMTGTRGQFVELILNDEYRGIYCMTENLDRKQMKLKKYDETTQTQHGQLWKSKDWSYAVFMGTQPDGNYYPKDFLSTPNNYSDMWDSYQVKYPDPDDVMPTDWQTLYDAVYFVSTASDEMFCRDIAQYFDLPVVIDYYILMETIMSSDNHGKNLFFAVYDKQKAKKITLGVWDMDATCGQRWSDEYFHSTLMQPEQDYAEFIARYEHGDYNLFKRLRDTDAEDFNRKVRLRYQELRNSHLATNNILQRFHNYFDLFATAGADQREYDRWNGDTDIARHTLDFEDEMDYIDDWFTRRMNYLDTKRFDLGALPTESYSMTVADNKDNTLFDLQGRRVTSQPERGLYIVNGKKYFKK